MKPAEQARENGYGGDQLRCSLQWNRWIRKAASGRQVRRLAVAAAVALNLNAGREHRCNTAL
jgi:hypothetical protein